MRILVLGATGFIGGHIARAACGAGLEVRGLRRKPDNVGAAGDLGLEWRTGDLLDAASLRAAMQGCEVVYHAAAYYPLSDRVVEVAVQKGRTEIESVLAAAREAGVRRLVYTSSLSTIGPAPTGSARLADERDPYVPGSARSAYYEAKWAMEQAALSAAGDGLEVLALVPSAVFGPGDVKPTTGQVLRDLALGRFPVGVHAQTNFVDVREVAQAHLQAARAGLSGERTIIGGHNMDIADALREAAQAAGLRPPLLALPRGAVVGLLKLVGGLPLPIPELVKGLAHWQPLNCEKGWQTFGFTPRPYAETARDTIDWFREHGYI